MTWALGHLVTLADPGRLWKRISILAFRGFADHSRAAQACRHEKDRETISSSGLQLARKDVKDIVIATDAGREGELVARWILEKARNEKAFETTMDFICHGQSHSRRLQTIKKTAKNMITCIAQPLRAMKAGLDCRHQHSKSADNESSMHSFPVDRCKHQRSP
ncbi:toprim domain-containing protein [Bacillus sp. SL00103]